MILLAIIIVAAMTALAATGVFSVTRYAEYAKERLVHVREMAKLREASDEGAHRRYIEMRKLEDQIALPADQKMAAMETSLAEARAREAEARARADSAGMALDKYRDNRRRLLTSTRDL